MPKVSIESAPNVNDMGIAVDRNAELDDHTVNFVSIREDHSLEELLKGLPDDRCQCPHWGYIFEGQLTVTYADREEIFTAGDAFYMTPGHVPAAKAGSEFVQFSPTKELTASMAVMQANAQKLMADH